MSAAFNYGRMPGPGDLPGDSRHPNSPDYIEPDYGYEEAERDVAERLVADDEVDTLVNEVRSVAPLLRWLEKQDIPAQHVIALGLLARRAGAIESACDKLIEARS